VKETILIVVGGLYCLVVLLMTGAVLLQESKGGGLSALGGTRAESAFGASNPLRKVTAWLAVFFFLLASALALTLPGVTAKGVNTGRVGKTGQVQGKEKDDDKAGNTGTEITVPIKEEAKGSGDKSPVVSPKPVQPPVDENK
jgi:protein translocase SecG subunit